MKRALLVLVALAVCSAFPFAARADEPQAKPASCEYTGTVKQKLEKPDRIVVETQADIKEFYFKHPAPKGCNSSQDLAVGDRVRISCQEQNGRIQAICVQKIRSGATLRGGTIKGGKIQ
jgi:hypothetical protein